MPKIIGNTTATPNPRPDWAQADSTKADFIKNKPALGDLAAKNTVDKTDLAADVQASLGKADIALQSETDPTVPAWAKESTKPAYNLGEISDTANRCAIHIVHATSEDGITYTGTIDGVTELTAGLTIMFIANVASTTSGSFLDINGFGRKSIMRYVAFTANSEFRNLVSVPKIFTKTPILLTYDAVGSWVAHGLTVPVSSDLDGLVPIYKGGTNASTTAEARTNLGVPSVTEMNTALNSALGYGYPFYYADGYLVQGQALSNKSYTLTVMSDVEESYIITVSNKAILSTNALIGRWVLIDGKRAYVGANTLNQLVLYTDSTLTTQFNITCTAGTIIYPADGTFTDLTAVEEKIQNDISSAISKIPAWAKESTKPAYNLSEISDTSSYVRMTPDERTRLSGLAKGTANGVAELDANGKVPSAQLPSYVDDVLEYSAKASFPVTGETDKIYIDTTTNITYRWGGSTYVPIGSDLALGETSSTAYYGDKGKEAYEHSLITSANPHGVTLSHLGLTATAAELNYVAGVKSAIQDQLDTKTQVQFITWEAND